jgi:capsid portal protein
MVMVRDPILGFFKEEQHCKFRRWALLARDTNTVQLYYKSFGDPRVVSRKTGNIYSSLDELNLREPGVLAATELFQYALPFAGSTAYGKNVWSGNGAALEATRDLDEETLRFINDEVMPSLLMLVAGPRIGDEEVKRFQAQVEEKAKKKGRGMLLLNAWNQKSLPGVPTPTAAVHVERLKSEQVNEAIFREFKADAREQTHMSFRLPGIALGVTGKGTNRAVAMVMRRFAEDQVYTPRRNWYARRKNMLLDALHIQCWRYHCNAVPPRDPESLANIIKTLMESGVLTPSEGRNLSEVIFNEKFANLPGAWAQLPTKLLVGVLQTKNPTLAAALMHEGEVSMQKLSDILKTGMLEAAEQVQGERDAGQQQREPEGGTNNTD